MREKSPTEDPLPLAIFPCHPACHPAHLPFPHPCREPWRASSRDRSRYASDPEFTDIIMMDSPSVAY